MAIKILIGGSPCTFWSIAQKNNRETVAEGLGWELFKNFLIAKEKFKPDFFLYENNKSAAAPIKDQISRELGVDLMYINSALVSAQNRQRFYAFNWTVEQPEDRGILLRDVLESGVCWREKGYTLDANYYKTLGQIGFDSQAGRRKMVAEPVNITADGKAQCLRATCYKDGIRNLVANTIDRKTCVAEPVGVGFRNRREDDGQLHRRFETHGESKANALTTVQTDSMVAEPIVMYDTPHGFNMGGIRERTKANALTANGDYQSNHRIVEPVRIGAIESAAQNKSHDSKQYRVYSPDGKSTTPCGNGGGVGAKTGLYACPVDTPVCLRYERTAEAKAVRKAYEAGEIKHGYHELHELHPRTDGKSNTVTTVLKDNMIIQRWDEKTYPIYEVQDGLITIKEKQYPIRLADGYYIIRKLTPVECERLQTMPDGYTAAVSNTQRYKGLGNGWTAEVIIHILQGALWNIPKDEEIVVLSMYDGIGTGRYCLDKMGFTNVTYYAYEIDKPAMKVALSNYPDIIQLGDAFAVRETDWTMVSSR